ncbi:hypothetical protein B23_0760 [Geobacillus thermoleovorans B23]|nr:hypothetical protein B23_0760 [Geobacillus thermoleovorans B23]
MRRGSGLVLKGNGGWPLLFIFNIWPAQDIQ